METSPHCTVSPARSFWDLLWLGSLTLAVLLIHGFHPWAEDGGLYVAGVEYLLRPTLFPKETAFVTEHLRFSLFAPAIAGFVRVSRLPLASVLLDAYLLSAFLTLLAAWRIAAQCFRSRSAQWTAVSALAVGWTLPVAGTSLLLMDPYVTARSFSTPFSLLAIASALRWVPAQCGSVAEQNPGRVGRSLRTLLPCLFFLALAAAMHPLMAGYAFVFVAVLLCDRAFGLRPVIVLLALALASAAAVQALSSPESPAVVEAGYSRYYWFLSRWQWYEWLGLVLPLGVLLSIFRVKPRSLSPAAIRLCRAAVLQALGGIATTMCFARMSLSAHPIARLQPLRSFLLVYAIMALLLGGLLAALGSRRGGSVSHGSWLQPMARSSPGLLLIALSAIMFHVQRAEFPLSPHVEFPGRINNNPWFQAFLWSRAHTREDALFALDARYVNIDGEDAQTFRAVAERSAIPDYSKDGGEAAITPELAAEWQRSARATRNLNQLGDTVRDEELRPFRVQWMILDTSAATVHPCPYRNDTVKVCDLR